MSSPLTPPLEQFAQLFDSAQQSTVKTMDNSEVSARASGAVLQFLYLQLFSKFTSYPHILLSSDLLKQNNLEGCVCSVGYQNTSQCKFYYMLNPQYQRASQALIVTDSLYISFLLVYIYFLFLFFSLYFHLCKDYYCGLCTADCAPLSILLLWTVDCAHSCLMYYGLIAVDCRLRTLHVYKVTH
jgi:hypothetical protein